jgi:hypothetical protein
MLGLYKRRLPVAPAWSRAAANSGGDKPVENERRAQDQGGQDGQVTGGLCAQVAGGVEWTHGMMNLISVWLPHGPCCIFLAGAVIC